jgi:hypothetical protein
MVDASHACALLRPHDHDDHRPTDALTLASAVVLIANKWLARRPQNPGAPVGVKVRRSRNTNWPFVYN